VKKMLVVAIVAVIAFFAQSEKALALDWIYINDVSRLSWQAAPDGKVYFRNLSSFNGSFLPCCYNYWLDATTPWGKTMWAAILTKNATTKGLWLGVESATAPSAVVYLGEW
jgi:hypothetical protein